METNVSYTAAGAFVIVLLSAIIIGILWLSSGLSSEKYLFYRINMKESVSGLNLDAAVEFNGVNVGSVSEINLDEKNPQVVELVIKIKQGTPITLGTLAKLNIRTMAGISYIQLVDKGNNLTPYLSNNIKPYPLLKTTPSLYLRFEAILTQLTNNVDQITRSIQVLFSNENVMKFRQLLNSSAGTLQLIQTQSIPAMNATMANMDEVARSVTNLSTEISRNPSILIRGKDTQYVLGPGEK